MNNAFIFAVRLTKRPTECGYLAPNMTSEPKSNHNFLKRCRRLDLYVFAKMRPACVNCKSQRGVV